HPARSDHPLLANHRQPAGRQPHRRIPRRNLGDPHGHPNPLPRPIHPPDAHRRRPPSQPPGTRTLRRPDRRRASHRRRPRRGRYRSRRRNHGRAGGELLIPTIVLLYGLDIKVAGSLSLAISLPTMLVAFARYSQDHSFTVLGQNKTFLVAMAMGSVVGVVAGGALLGVVPTAILVPALALLLVLSARKVWQHG
ncbi:MAG: sulfite exporter TauE/SafE family protein, partial [Micropruina sp.]|nr:sulfite exporter TauE/SafE family protein [Micropruina sp.]